MQHDAGVVTWEGGYLGICHTCGERNDEVTGFGTAREWAELHELQPFTNQRGASMGLVAQERMFRERAAMRIYTGQERDQWLTLADEIADRLKKKTDQLEGQMDLFGEED